MPQISTPGRATATYDYKKPTNAKFFSFPKEKLPLLFRPFCTFEISFQGIGSLFFQPPTLFFCRHNSDKSTTFFYQLQKKKEKTITHTHSFGTKWRVKIFVRAKIFSLLISPKKISGAGIASEERYFRT